MTTLVPWPPEPLLRARRLEACASHDHDSGLFAAAAYAYVKAAEAFREARHPRDARRCVAELARVTSHWQRTLDAGLRVVPSVEAPLP